MQHMLRKITTAALCAALLLAIAMPVSAADPMDIVERMMGINDAVARAVQDALPAHDADSVYWGEQPPAAPAAEPPARQETAGTGEKEPGETAPDETPTARSEGTAYVEYVEPDPLPELPEDTTPHPPVDEAAEAALETLLELSGTETPIDERAAELGKGVVLRQASYWTGSDYQTEQYITISPGSAYRPMVYSGDPLTAGGTLAGRAAEVEAMGLHVAAGVNGGFYTMSNGIPVGIIAENGALRSDDEGLNAIGFRAGGGAIIGRPEIALTLDTGTTDMILVVSTLNRTRGDYLALFTSDFSGTTSAAGEGWNVFCIPSGNGKLPMSGSVTLTVERVEFADGPVVIPEGRMVLSLGSADSYWMEHLSPGDELTLKVTCARGWEDVESAVCLLYPLLEDGGLVEGLEKDTGAAPRTAVGVRADGGVVLYTVDGRQSGYSVGKGLDAVAKRMLELGCVAAGALDGGASTQLSAVLPGDTELTNINRPSAVRNVANYLFVVTQDQPIGQAARLALYPMDIDALAGAEISLTVKAVDENGYPAKAPENLTFAVTEGLGVVRDGVFYAAGSGSGVITVSAPGLEPAAIPVTVADTPDDFTVYGEVYGQRITALTLDAEQEVDLTVRAYFNHVLLTGGDENFTWNLENTAGTVDQTGHVTAGAASGTGMLTVRAGEQSREIPITVWSGIPYSDVPVTSPRFEAVRYVHEHNLFEGTGDTIFEPETVMNRAMLVTVLWRMNGKPEAAELPAFRDVDPEAWYGPAVAWGVERGMIEGYSDTEFGPEDVLTKEQILTILWRYAGRPETLPAMWGANADAGKESPYAHEALVWALTPEKELFDRESGYILPQAVMTRAAVADVLMRFLTIYEE